MKICIVCSAGGHLLQASQLKGIFPEQDVLWVSFKKEDARSILKGQQTIWGYYPTQRNIYNLIRNTFLAIRVFSTHKIDAVISTGAGVAVPFIYLGKLLGKKTIFIETIARINDLSLSGKICYPVVDHFLVQWPELTKKYRKARYEGRLL